MLAAILHRTTSWKEDFLRTSFGEQTSRKKRTRLTASTCSTPRTKIFPVFPIRDFRNRNRRSFLASRNRPARRSQISSGFPNLFYLKSRNNQIGQKLRNQIFPDRVRNSSRRNPKPKKKSNLQPSRCRPLLFRFSNF